MFNKFIEMTKKPILKMALFTVLMLSQSNIISANQSKPYVIAAFGDSLSAGYGLAPGESFSEQLAEKFISRGYSDVIIQNAGNSGDTSADGLARLDWTLGDDVDMVILEFGANDGLRGLSIEAAKANLEAMINRLQERDIAILLTGMQAAPNMGEAYREDFAKIYPTLAKEYDIALYPFFLEGVAANPTLNQNDGIHPNKEGVKIIVDNIFPYVEKVMAEDRKRQADTY